MIDRLLALGQHWTTKAIGGCLLFTHIGLAMATDDNPWGFASPSDPKSIEATTGKTMSHSLRWILMGVGTFMMVSAVVMLVGVMNKSAEDKKAEHSNSIIVVIVALLCVIVGGIFLALGWKGTSYAGT